MAILILSAKGHPKLKDVPLNQIDGNRGKPKPGITHRVWGGAVTDKSKMKWGRLHGEGLPQIRIEVPDDATMVFANLGVKEVASGEKDNRWYKLVSDVKNVGAAQFEEVAYKDVVEAGLAEPRPYRYKGSKVPPPPALKENELPPSLVEALKTQPPVEQAPVVSDNPWRLDFDGTVSNEEIFDKALLLLDKLVEVIEEETELKDRLMAYFASKLDESHILQALKNRGYSIDIA